ncbi:hypothetical protein SEUCBS140593_007998 [Sporothrix eucalyptigena]|uniref:HNH nuclease domain-containing protein n=1 Tax=Sporothrix eucalyptigena TaxID=1812306 RepID=A0ABP0CIF8_9PEZI
MVDMLFENEGPYQIRDGRRNILKRSNRTLQRGCYYVSCLNNKDEQMRLSDEAVLLRPLWLGQGQKVWKGRRVRNFAAAVQERDLHCVVTGRQPTMTRDCENLADIAVAHIFPSGHQTYWDEHKMGEGIHPAPGGKINSMENGLLMTRKMHYLFNQYAFSINPDDGHRIVWFQSCPDFIALQKHLPWWTLNSPLRPNAKLLRWHFRQAVLCNMRGYGLPNFPSSKNGQIESILEGPMVAKRLEAEIFGAVALDVDLKHLKPGHNPVVDREYDSEEDMEAMMEDVIHMNIDKNEGYVRHWTAYR